MPERPQISVEETTNYARPTDSPKDTDSASVGTLAERRPDWPPVKLAFFFSSHKTAKDMLGLKRQLNDADIYMYEDYRGCMNADFYQMVANRQPTDDIDQFISRVSVGESSIVGTEVETQLRALYGTNIIVGHMDLRPASLI